MRQSNFPTRNMLALGIALLMLIQAFPVLAQGYDWSSPSTVFYEHPEIIQEVILNFSFTTDCADCRAYYSYHEVFPVWDPDRGFISGPMCEVITNPASGTVYRHPLEKEMSFVQIGGYRVNDSTNFELVDSRNYQLQGLDVRLFVYHNPDLPDEFKAQEGFIELIPGSGEYFGWYIMESCLKTYGESMPKVEDVLADFLSTIKRYGYLTPDQQAVTLDYMYFERAYGLNVEDGDQPWKQEELRLLDEALRQIPQELLDRLPVRSLQRYATDWDENWKPLPGQPGKYSNSTSPDRPSQLMIFDSAFTMGRYYPDPSGRTQFKAVLFHELIHSLQEGNPNGGTFKNKYDSPVMQDFMNATRPVNPQDPTTTYGWEWNAAKKRYIYYFWSETETEQPPYRQGESTTNAQYSMKNPLEDMSVSVELYMCNPQTLKTQSPTRYKYVHDKIFGGAEYENCNQKP